MITPDGKEVGVHNGLHTLTVGQGARIKGASSKYFVAKKLLDTNQVVVVQGKWVSSYKIHETQSCCFEHGLYTDRLIFSHDLFSSLNLWPHRDHPLLLCSSLVANHINWIWSTPPLDVFSLKGLSVLAQVRHRQDEVKCVVKGERSSLGQVRYKIEFQEPVLAVAEGQIVGLWKGDWCLGSGTIDEVITLGDVQNI